MNPSKKLKAWFRAHARSLPWRHTRDPYAIWVSEVMLQQTQVSVVIPYYYRWLKAFPNVLALASAEEEKVIKLWEGLGYYSRARSLHRGAKLVCKEYRGELPNSEEELLKIPGIGPYTAAAIASFAFHKKALALDGNVLRVLSRYLGHYGLISKEGVKKELKNLGEKLLCDEEPWIGSEALIEMGALVCKKGGPECSICPLKDSCIAYQKNLQSELPNVPKRKKTVRLYRAVLVGISGSKILVKQPSDKGVMKGLYEFPFVELKGPEEASPIVIEKYLKNLGNRSEFLDALETQKHGFTHHSATLYPYVFSLKGEAILDCKWVDIESLKGLPFSSGHRKVLANLKVLLGFLRSEVASSN